MFNPTPEERRQIQAEKALRDEGIKNSLTKGGSIGKIGNMNAGSYVAPGEVRVHGMTPEILSILFPSKTIEECREIKKRSDELDAKEAPFVQEYIRSQSEQHAAQKTTGTRPNTHSTNFSMGTGSTIPSYDTVSVGCVNFGTVIGEPPVGLVQVTPQGIVDSVKPPQTPCKVEPVGLLEESVREQAGGHCWEVSVNIYAHGKSIKRNPSIAERLQYHNRVFPQGFEKDYPSLIHDSVSRSSRGPWTVSVSFFDKSDAERLIARMNSIAEDMFHQPEPQ